MVQLYRIKCGWVAGQDFHWNFLGQLYGSLPFSVGRRNIQTTAPSAEIRNWESEKGCKSSSTWEAVTSSSILKNTGKYRHCGNQTFQLSRSKSHGESENLEIARQFHWESPNFKTFVFIMDKLYQSKFGGKPGFNPILIPVQWELANLKWLLPVRSTWIVKQNLKLTGSLLSF